MSAALLAVTVASVFVVAASPAFAQATSPAPAPSAETPAPAQPVDPPAGPNASLPTAPAGVAAPAAAAPAPIDPPADYVIGPDDVLSIVFWRDEQMTRDVVVRPDGRISLPVLNEIQASGLTPEGLRAAVTEAALKFFEAPSVHVVVKQINSRKVFITGEVGKPGPYPLSTSMTVIQLLALAGGLNEYAKKNDVAVIRTENGKQTRFRMRYGDIIQGRNLPQNIELKPGDVVIVP